MDQIFYGIENHYKDITSDAITKCIYGNKLVIPASDHNRAA